MITKPAPWVFFYLPGCTCVPPAALPCSAGFHLHAHQLIPTDCLHHSSILTGQVPCQPVIKHFEYQSAPPTNNTVNGKYRPVELNFLCLKSTFGVIQFKITVSQILASILNCIWPVPPSFGSLLPKCGFASLSLTLLWSETAQTSWPQKEEHMRPDWAEVDGDRDARTGSDKLWWSEIPAAPFHLPVVCYSFVPQWSVAKPKILTFSPSPKKKLVDLKISSLNRKKTRTLGKSHACRSI